MEVKVIARIENDYKEKFGIPRQSGLVKSSLSKITFEPEFRDGNAVRGMEGYSHLWLLWQFSENMDAGWSPTVRPPRLGGNVRMGVFATRSPLRPNPIGLSCVELDHMEYGDEGPVIYVKGADLMDGTPLVDIKPYVPYTDSHPEAESGFAGDVFDHHMKVEISDELLEEIPKEKREAVLEMLAQDPRPGYQKNNERIYGIEYGDMNIRFRAEDCRITVTDVERRDREQEKNQGQSSTSYGDKKV
ncbi:MAG: tRNA (N6-threonylcarbamoyladenosine(37)-N6)-methyltransferase TrmO [Lachnospiraceae bacterium]|nr:tRNA (N6-threonylcarbamoyladenosine(37)-N6)-methyltransferase TrmO [Lachnospiraceae bacterium]